MTQDRQDELSETDQLKTWAEACRGLVAGKWMQLPRTRQNIIRAVIAATGAFFLIRGLVMMS